MSRPIQYSDEPLGELKVVADFLPPPSELVLKNQNTKITISLSSESIDYFKSVAAEYGMQYQRMIREVLDSYVAHQKQSGKV